MQGLHYSHYCAARKKPSITESFIFVHYADLIPLSEFLRDAYTSFCKYLYSDFTWESQQSVYTHLALTSLKQDAPLNYFLGPPIMLTQFNFFI